MNRATFLRSLALSVVAIPAAIKSVACAQGGPTPSAGFRGIEFGEDAHPFRYNAADDEALTFEKLKGYYMEIQRGYKPIDPSVGYSVWYRTPGDGSLARVP